MINIKKSFRNYIAKPIHCVQIKLLVLDRNLWNQFTVYKQINSGSFKNNVTYICVFDIYV